MRQSVQPALLSSLLIFVLAGCSPVGGPDAGALVRWGIPMPPAANDFPASPGQPRPTVDGGDGLAELRVSSSGPAGGTVSFRVGPSDGGPPIAPGRDDSQDVYRVPPLGEFRVDVALDGGSALQVVINSGRAGSMTVVDERLLKLSLGLKLAPRANGAAVPWNASWIHRGTGSVLVRWEDSIIELARDPASPTGIRRFELGPATSQGEPCFPREGTLAFVPLSSGTIAWDLVTHTVIPGTPADVDPTQCQTARKGVPRALLRLTSGGVSVLSWTGAGVTEVFREPAPVRPAFSADGTTVGLIRPGASPSGWVGERIDVATGTRSPVAVPGPGDPFLPSDGRVLLVLSGCTTVPSAWCLLEGASPQPLGNIVGMAVADDAPKVLIAQRDYDMQGTLVDRLVQIDLVTGVQVAFTPPGYSGLPQKRWLVRGNLLPIDRGVASALTATAVLTDQGRMTAELASDGSVWVVHSTGTSRLVLHETGAPTSLPLRGVRLNGAVLDVGRVSVTRSFVSPVGGSLSDPRWGDAVCVPYISAELLRRDGTPLTQAVYCSP